MTTILKIRSLISVSLTNTDESIEASDGESISKTQQQFLSNPLTSLVQSRSVNWR